MNYSLLCKVIAAPIVINCLFNLRFANEEMQKKYPLKAALIFSPFAFAAPTFCTTFDFGVSEYKHLLLYTAVSTLGALSLYKACVTKRPILLIAALPLIGLQCFWNFAASTDYLDID